MNESTIKLLKQYSFDYTTLYLSNHNIKGSLLVAKNLIILDNLYI